MLLTTLRSMSCLHDMETSHLKKLAAIATMSKFSADQIIYREGDVGTAIYFVQEGQVAIEMNSPDGSRVNVLTVVPGQLFGWSSLFPSRRKTASARALTSTKVIMIKAADLRDLFQTDHALEYALFQRVTEVVADRLKVTRQQFATRLNSDSEAEAGRS